MKSKFKVDEVALLRGTKKSYLHKVRILQVGNKMANQQLLYVVEFISGKFKKGFTTVLESQLEKDINGIERAGKVINDE
jgi:hypothetical protein